MTTLVMMLASLAAAPPSPDSSACSFGLNMYYRDAAAGYMTLRATSDTVLDGTYFSSGRGVTRQAPDWGERPTRVYGQVFELLSAHGVDSAALSTHRRIVLIWWGLSGSCTRSFPYAARRMSNTDVFVAKRPRDPAEWIDGMPTFDIDARDWADVWYPGLRHDTLTTRAMTLREYMSLYRLFPVKNADTEEEIAAWRAMIRWGEADRTRWRLDPARQALCVVAVRFSNWSRDEVSALLERENCPGRRLTARTPRSRAPPD